MRGYVSHNIKFILCVGSPYQPTNHPTKHERLTHAKPHFPQTPSNPAQPSTRSSNRPSLKVILLPLHPLRLALTNNALTQPLGLKALIELGQVLDDKATRRHDGFFGCNGTVGLDAEFKGSEEGVGHFVRGEHDGGVLEEALREEVAERVVFFVEGEDGGIGDAC
jgi:hypothetical protein